MFSTPNQTMDQSAQHVNPQWVRQVINHRMRPDSGMPIPPYPFTGEVFIEYATKQQEAARIRDYMFDQYNMKEDVNFNLSTDSISEVDSQAPSTYESDSRPIVSESDPEFGEVALRLAALQKASGITPMLDAQPARRFRPSHLVLNRTGLVHSPSRDSKYRGKPIRTVPDSLNCAVWLSNLHPATTVADLAQMVRTGAIYAMHIVPAQHGFHTAAASIVFMKHSVAEAFLMQSEAPQGIWIRRTKIKAIYNMHGETDTTQTERSRVLRIRGPSEEMDLSFWQKFFTRCVEYQLSHVRQIRSGDVDKAAMEFDFARMRGQADSVLKAIREQEKFRGIFEVQYAPDPCDPTIHATDRW